MIALLAGLAGCQRPTEPGAQPQPPFTLVAAHNFPTLAEGDFIRSFDFQSDGTLWVATFSGALIEKGSGGTTFHHGAEGLGQEAVNSLFIDHEDRVWVTFGHGYAVHEVDVWTRFDPPSVISTGTSIRQIAVNHAGDILLAAGHATAGGLLLRTGDVWRALRPDNSLMESSIIQALAVDGNDFWFGSGQYQGRGGLGRIAEGEVVELITAQDGLLYAGVDALAVAGDRLYLGFKASEYDVPGADGGLQALSRTDHSLTSFFPVSSGMTSSRVQALVHTSRGGLWLTTALDEAQPTCPMCYTGVGHLDAEGVFHVVSAVNSDVAPNEPFFWIQDDPAGDIYVTVGEREIRRVVY